MPCSIRTREQLTSNNFLADGITDLAQMLTFRRWEMGQPQVNVGPDELFRKDACYLVVGGLTGLGWLCVQV